MDENAAPCDHGGSGPHNEHLATTKDVFGEPYGRVFHSDVG